MTHAKGPKKGARIYQKHGLSQLKTAVKTLGNRAIDQRTQVGKALAEWQTGIIADLGGYAALSTQELAILDLAVKTKLLLDSIDGWLLRQPSLINVRRRSLIPAVKERTALADALARYLGQLGLERRKVQVDIVGELAALAKENKAPGAGNE